MELHQFKAGTFRREYQYRSFLPEQVHHEWVLTSPKVVSLLSEANRLIGELNAFSQYIPDVDFFIMMHVVKEATTSSRIEGTQTSIEEALLSAEDLSPERRDDWQEVHNYIDAMNVALAELDRLPLSSRLLRQTHATLMQGVRGQHKQPGEFRTSQNWIGGATLNDATFVPPHHTAVGELMSDLEKFINDEDLDVPALIVIAIAHYQFETIHPFLDGNGRLGRLLITLYLVSKGLLTRPTLYLSDFLERNRTHYYTNLMLVRQNNDMEQWLRFFLVGVIETARKSIDTLKAILKLKEESEGQILNLHKRAPKGRQLLLELYKSPIITAGQVSARLAITPTTANTLIRDLMGLGILREMTGYRRNRLFVFQQYLDLFG